MADLLQRQLEDCIRTHELVELYRDRLTRDALVGRILQQSAYIIVAEKIDEVHGPDGLVAVRVRDVTRLKRGGRQLEGARTDYVIAPALESVALLELSSAMTMLHKRYGYASVYVEALDDSVCFIGEPRELDDNFVIMRQFGTFKALDRSEILIRMAEITRVAAGGKYESELMRRFAVTVAS